MASNLVSGQKTLAIKGASIDDNALPAARAGDGEIPKSGYIAEIAVIHASVHNHFNKERLLYSCENLKLNRSAAMAEWCQLAA